MRLLDRLEEIFIVVLMAAATLLIFVAVVQRYSLGLTADMIKFARGNDIAWLGAWARSAYMGLRDFNLVWAQELCIYLFVWMAKFGAAYGVRQGIHVGVDVLVERLSPEARRPITIFAFLASIAFTGLIAVIGFDFVRGVYRTGAISPDLELKMWIVYLAVPVGSALMCFRFIQALYWYVTTGFIAHHDHGHVDGVEEAELAAEGKA